MKIIISNKSKLGLKQVVVSKNNPIAKVNFSKVSKLVGTLNLSQLNDVNTAGQTDGAVLVYNANSNTYIVEALPNLDGGFF